MSKITMKMIKKESMERLGFKKKENPKEKLFYRILIMVLVLVSVIPALFLSFCFYYKLHPVKTIQEHQELIMYTFSWATAACWAGMAVHKTIVSFFPDFYVLLPKALGRMSKENGTVIWVVFVSLCVISAFGLYLLLHPDEFSSGKPEYPYQSSQQQQYYQRQQQQQQQQQQ